MKSISVIIIQLLLSFAASGLFGAESVDPNRAANTVILNEKGVENLGIQLAIAEESNFEETVFAVGRIEEIPERHAVLSSRIAGRIVEMNAFQGDMVEEGQDLVRVESRQAGDPPPVISLKAPISGLVVESHVRKGEPVEPAIELLDILDLGEVLAVARVPEHHASKLKPGQTTARIRVPALGDEFLAGSLLRLGTVADRESGTIDAIFRVPNPGLRLRPGMRAEFSIIVDQRKNVLSVPVEAIQGDPASRFVYVKDFDLPNAFVKSPVQTGARNDRFVEIKRGLFPGDEVVTVGSYLLGFAGGGGVSLKEALDAAHGHEHNEDGSEITPEQRSAGRAEAGEGPGTASSSPLTLFFGATSAILLVLLILSLVLRRKSFA